MTPSPSPGSVPPAEPGEPAARAEPVDSLVLHTTDNGVSWLTLNRPDAMNALIPDQRERLIGQARRRLGRPGRAGRRPHRDRQGILSAAPICAARRRPVNGSPVMSPG